MGKTLVSPPPQALKENKNTKNNFWVSISISLGEIIEEVFDKQ